MIYCINELQSITSFLEKLCLTNTQSSELMFQRYSLVHDHPCSYQIFVVIELAPEYFVQCLFSCIFSRLVVWDSGTSTDAVLF